MPYKYNLSDAFINVFLESFSERKICFKYYCRWKFGVTLQLVIPAPEQWICDSGESTKGQPADLPP